IGALLGVCGGCQSLALPHDSRASTSGVSILRPIAASEPVLEAPPITAAQASHGFFNGPLIRKLRPASEGPVITEKAADVVPRPRLTAQPPVVTEKPPEMTSAW